MSQVRRTAEHAERKAGVTMPSAVECTAALEFHPLANLFPLIEGSEFEDLEADIRANGLREEIMLCDGKALHGRNRYGGCLAAGITPRAVPFRSDIDGAPLA